MLANSKLLILDVHGDRVHELFDAYHTVRSEIWTASPEPNRAIDLSAIGSIGPLLRSGYEEVVGQDEAADLDWHDPSRVWHRPRPVVYGPGRGGGGFAPTDQQPVLELLRSASMAQLTQRQQWATSAAVLCGQWVFYEATRIGFHFGAKLSAHAYLHHVGCDAYRERCLNAESDEYSAEAYLHAMNAVIADVPVSMTLPEYHDASSWFAPTGIEDRYLPLALWFLSELMPG